MAQRTILFVTIAVLLVFSPSLSLAVPAQSISNNTRSSYTLFQGTSFHTTYDKLTFIRETSVSTRHSSFEFSITGKYDYRNGKVFGFYDAHNNTIQGVWSEDASGNCKDVGPTGTFSHGRFEFKFNRDLDRFEGKWGNCCGHLSQKWSGHLI